MTQSPVTTQTKNTAQGSDRTADKQSISELKNQFRELETEQLKQKIEDTKEQFREKYGYYEGVFSSTSPYTPSEKELQQLREKRAAEKVLKERGEQE